MNPLEILSIQGGLANPEFLIDALISINSAECKIMFLLSWTCAMRIHPNISSHIYVKINYQKQVKFFNVIMPFLEFVLAYHLLVRLDSDTYYRSENSLGMVTIHIRKNLKLIPSRVVNYRGSK